MVVSVPLCWGNCNAEKRIKVAANGLCWAISTFSSGVPCDQWKALVKHLTELYICDVWAEPCGDQLHNLGLVSTVLCLSNPPWGRYKMWTWPLSKTSWTLKCSGWSLFSDNHCNGKRVHYELLHSTLISAEVMGVLKGGWRKKWGLRQRRGWLIGAYLEGKQASSVYSRR